MTISHSGLLFWATLYTIMCLVYFAKDVEDWFGYDTLHAFLLHKFPVFMHEQTSVSTT